MNYQENLRKNREERGISEEQIAELLGRSRQSYRNIEKGKSKLKIRDLITLAEFPGSLPTICSALIRHHKVTDKSEFE